MTPEQAQAKVKEEALRSVGLHAQMEGYIKLYESSVMARNEHLVAKYREDLHTMLDLRLDSVSISSTIIRDLIAGKY